MGFATILALVASGFAATGETGAGDTATDNGARHLITPSEAENWRGVGSLRVAGLPSCTAVLISDHEAITAAHCVVDRATGRRVELWYFTLILGQRTDGIAALRKVVAVAFPPQFLTDDPSTGLANLASDLALLRLDRPVTAQEATPFHVADWANPTSTMVDIVGYERGGSKSATIRQACLALETHNGVTAVGCDLITGLSGSPVLLRPALDQPVQLVASVSARGSSAGYVVSIAPHLAQLRALIRTRHGARPRSQ